MNWAQRQRMEWISKRNAPFNRKHLMDKFDISTPQASNDIQAYLKMFPDSLKYNTKLKRYEVMK